MPKKPKREAKLYLQDIKECINKIGRYTRGLSFEEFKKDDLVIDAVVRNIEIIGEASNNIPREMKNAYPEVPWQDVIDMRNKVIHEYFGADIRVVWETVKKSIPELKNALKKGKK